MCSPDPVGLGLGAIGAGMQLFNQNAQQQAQSQLESYQAQIAQDNQVVAQTNEQNAINQGQRNLYQQQIKNASALGAAKAQMAANGLDLSSGSPMNVLDSDAMLSNLDAQNIQNNTLNQAYGYATQAMNQGAQSQMDQYKSNLSDLSANTGLANAGLNLANQVDGMW